MKKTLYVLAALAALMLCGCKEGGKTGPEKFKCIDIDVTFTTCEETRNTADLTFSYVADENGTIKTEPITSDTWTKTISIPAKDVEWSCSVNCQERADKPVQETYKILALIDYKAFSVSTNGARSHIKTDGDKTANNVPAENISNYLSKGYLSKVYPTPLHSSK